MLFHVSHGWLVNGGLRHTRILRMLETNLPLILYEDAMNQESKLMFYTSIPDRNIFEGLFDEIQRGCTS